MKNFRLLWLLIKLIIERIIITLLMFLFAILLIIMGLLVIPIKYFKLKIFNE